MKRIHCPRGNIPMARCMELDCSQICQPEITAIFRSQWEDSLRHVFKLHPWETQQLANLIHALYIDTYIGKF